MEKKEPPLGSISFIQTPLYSVKPLFSSIVAFNALILIYFPTHFLAIVFSPVLFFTGTLLFTLLRLGATQIKSEHELTLNSPSDEDHHHKGESLESISNAKPEMGLGFDSDPKPFYAESFVEWNVRAPLEVIYEEYEGEEKEVRGLERYPSLSLYYPETDSGSSSDGEYPYGGWDSPEGICFRWGEGEEEGEIVIRDDEMMIEIELDGGKRKNQRFQVEEDDNLIEIDL